MKKEEKDVFWPEFVPCGCRLASDLTDSEAGAPIVLVQTLKSLSETMAAPRLDEIKEFEELIMGRKRKMGMKNFGKSEGTSYAKTLSFSLINRRAVSAVSCAGSQCGLPLICP